MRLLTAVDQLFLLLESRKQPMHVGGLFLFELPQDGQNANGDFVYKLVQQMQNATVPPSFPFNQVLERLLFWKEDDRSIKHMSPTVLMTGNTTQLGINLTDYLRNRTPDNAKKLVNSSALVSSFLLGALVGALLYLKLSFWAVGLFVLPVLYLSVMARDKDFLSHIG